MRGRRAPACRAEQPEPPPCPECQRGWGSPAGPGGQGPVPEVTIQALFPLCRGQSGAGLHCCTKASLGGVWSLCPRCRPRAGDGGGRWVLLVFGGVPSLCQRAWGWQRAGVQGLCWHQGQGAGAHGARSSMSPSTGTGPPWQVLCCALGTMGEPWGQMEPPQSFRLAPC